jgi:hypothetical protein
MVILLCFCWSDSYFSTFCCSWCICGQCHRHCCMGGWMPDLMSVCMLHVISIIDYCIWCCWMSTSVIVHGIPPTTSKGRASFTGWVLHLHHTWPHSVCGCWWVPCFVSTGIGYQRGAVPLLTDSLGLQFSNSLLWHCISCSGEGTFLHQWRYLLSRSGTTYNIWQRN